VETPVTLPNTGSGLAESTPVSLYLMMAIAATSLALALITCLGGSRRQAR
jgi:hypothetical protein